MSIIHNVAITLLFVNSVFTALGSKLNNTDPIVINNNTVPLPITEIYPGSSQPPLTKSPPTVGPVTNSYTSTTEKPPVTPVDPSSSTPPPNTTPITVPTTQTPSTTPNTTIPTTSATPPPTNKPTITTSSTTKTTVTTAATTVKPTGTPPTTPVPSHRRFDGPSFIGGIVLALGLVAIGFVAFKFYKARTELNYHTL